jgi:hypothetical protein
MPYPANHRMEVKSTILDSARRLFNRYGFDNVSISQIMEGANLTHGGFYSYFKTKSDLYAEVRACFFTDPNWKNCWEGVNVDLKSTDVGKQVVRAYLSRQHLENVENSCPMVALPSYVARSGKNVKHAFETVLPYSRRWSVFWSVVCWIRGPVTQGLRPSPLCAWAEWLLLGLLSTAPLPMNCERHA